MELDQFRDVDVVLDKANDRIIQGQFVSEGDYNGRTMTVMVTDGGAVRMIPGLQVSLLWTNQANRLTDEHAFELIDADKSIFRIEFPNNMLTAGTVVANIRIWLDGKVMTTKPFSITVGTLAGKMSAVIQQQEFGLLTAKLAEANKWRTDIDRKAEQTSVDRLTSEKADKTYVDTVLSSIASGGPKELFYSLAALKAKYPQGAVGTYLVFDTSHPDGAHSYMWKDGAWVDLGVYQGVEIADNSITATKMDENYKTSFMEARALSYTFKKGFYSSYSLQFEANPQFNSIAQAVNSGEIYEITTKIQDATIPIVMFFKDAECTQYLSHIDGDLGVDYVAYTINVPIDAKGLGISGRNTANLSLSKKTEINMNEIKNDFIYKDLITDVTTTNGYYHTADSQFVNNASYRTITTDRVSEGDTIYFSANASTPTVATCVFWSAPGVKILTVGAGSIKVFNDEMVTAPKGTTLVTVTSHVSVTPLLKMAKKLVADEIIQKIEDIDKSRESSNNHFFRKKIGWIGTSVPFGANASKSYAKEAAEKLGFDLVNMSVPGQAIHTTSDGLSLTYGSTTLSKAEYASQDITIASSPIPYVPGGAYNSYYRTWENIFTAENSDIDLWVFDVVPNNNNFNITDWEMFDRANWKYTDDSDFADHRSTFLGALLFLMDKMYELNPNARMVLVLGSAFSYVSGKSNLELLKNSWNIPVIDIWSKVNTSPKSLLKIRSNNGTDNHPSTFGHEILGNMLANELLLIS